MVQLDLPCCIFHENESEKFLNFLERVDALADPDPDKVFPKFNADEYNKFKLREWKCSIRKWLLTISSMQWCDKASS